MVGIVDAPAIEAHDNFPTSGLRRRVSRLPDVRGSPAAASGSRGQRVPPLVEPRGVSIRSKYERCERRFLRQVSGSCADARRNPIGKGDRFGHVTSRLGVDLAHLRKMIQWKPACRSDKSWPQPPMDKRDLSLDKTAHENIVAVANRLRHRENLVTLRMRPPATPHWLSSYGVGNRRDRPLRGFEHDTVLTNESESLA
jgi:hypothetical protein